MVPAIRPASYSPLAPSRTTLVLATVTFAESAIAKPTTQRIWPPASATRGMRDRSHRGIFPSTKMSCTFFVPRRPSGEILSPRCHDRITSLDPTAEASRQTPADLPPTLAGADDRAR